MNWRPSKRVENAFFRDISELLRSLTSPGSPDPLGDFTARLLGSAEFVQKYAWQAAQRMVLGVMQENARDWRQAARESMRGAMVYGALQSELQGVVGVRMRQLIAENATLISSLPARIAATAAQRLSEAQAAGGRAEESAPLLLRHLSRVRAMLIARTETSKASTALTQARSEHLNLPWYVWQTSEDAKVRLAHRKMQGVLVRFDSPPSPERLAREPKPPAPYNAGNVWNCRCYPAPLVRLGDLKWPRRVYHAGIVSSMTLSDFKRINSARFVKEAA